MCHVQSTALHPLPLLSLPISGNGLFLLSDTQAKTLVSQTANTSFYNIFQAHYSSATPPACHWCEPPYHCPAIVIASQILLQSSHLPSLLLHPAAKRTALFSHLNCNKIQSSPYPGGLHAVALSSTLPARIHCLWLPSCTPHLRASAHLVS